MVVTVLELVGILGINKNFLKNSACAKSTNLGNWAFVKSVFPENITPWNVAVEKVERLKFAYPENVALLKITYLFFWKIIFEKSVVPGGK